MQSAHRVRVMPKCEMCGRLFEAHTAHHRYCSDPCRYRAKLVLATPETVRRTRERCRAWAERARGCSRRQPWLLGAPPYGDHLPGGAFALEVHPTPRWAVEHRSVRALHGMVTAIMGRPHHPTLPEFSLVPTTTTGFGWGVYVRDEEVARRLALGRHQGVLFDRHVEVRTGALHRLRAPMVRQRGRRRLRIDAITPVCVRQNASTSTYTAPAGGNLTSTLASWMPARLGVQIEQDSVRVEMVDRETFPSTIPTGGKFGVTRGWLGHCVVETNAVGEWLLRCAAMIGLGGRTALGFGRIKVMAC